MIKIGPPLTLLLLIITWIRLIAGEQEKPSQPVISNDTILFREFIDLASVLARAVKLDPNERWTNKLVQLDHPSPEIRVPKPIPVSQGTSDTPVHQVGLLPTSIYLELVPFPRRYPGRSLLFARIDDYNRLRFAIGLNQWGTQGELMELWIHHWDFYSAEPNFRGKFRRKSGGLADMSGLIVVPLPRHRNIRRLAPITLIIELTNFSAAVAVGCRNPKEKIFQITFDQLDDRLMRWKYHYRKKQVITSPYNKDWLHLLSGGPLHDDRFYGTLKEMKLFFSEPGAMRYCLMKNGINGQRLGSEWARYQNNTHVAFLESLQDLWRQETLQKKRTKTKESPA